MYYVFAAICVYIVPVIIAGSLYTIILVIVSKKVHATPVLIGKKESIKENQRLERTTLRPNFGNTKGAKTVMIVFSGWVVCWVPYFSLILGVYWKPRGYYELERRHKWLAQFISTIVADVLPCINSCINPFIYFKTNSLFRYYLKDSYLKLLKQPRRRIESSVGNVRGSYKIPSLNTRVK